MSLRDLWLGYRPAQWRFDEDYKRECRRSWIRFPVKSDFFFCNNLQNLSSACTLRRSSSDGWFTYTTLNCRCEIERADLWQSKYVCRTLRPHIKNK